MPTSPLVRLGPFRTELHACYTCRADALFELGDALLCTQTFSALPPDRPQPAPPSPLTGQRPTRHARRVKSQA
jgi:hypothetical protein